MPTETPVLEWTDQGVKARYPEAVSRGECVIWVPLGYSPVYGSQRQEHYDPGLVKAVLGPYATIHFRTIRFGTYLYEVTITRRGCAPWTQAGATSDIVDVVGGYALRPAWLMMRPADKLRLSTGQTLTILGFDRQYTSWGLGLRLVGKPQQ